MIPIVTHKCNKDQNKVNKYATTVKPLLRGHPDWRPPPLERPLDNVNLNINVLISTPDERTSLLKGHFSDAKWVASQEGFHYIYHDVNMFQKMKISRIKR